MSSRIVWSIGPALVVLACFPVAAGAAGVSLGPTGGTTGVGLEGTVQFSDNAGLRFSHGVMGARTSFSYNSIPYAFDASLDWLGAFLDLYPTSSSFRLSAGAMAVTGDVSVEVESGSPVSIGGNTYSPDQLGRIGGQVTLEPVVPYLGIGWDSRRSNAFGFSLDLGVAVQKFDLELSQSGGTLPAELRQILTQHVDAEEQDLERQINRLGVFPVIRAGFCLSI